MASVALRLLRDWALVSELLLDARDALARSSGELGWAYARADGIEVAALAQMQRVDDQLAQVLKRLSDHSRGQVRYEEHLVQGLTNLARQGRHLALVRRLARLVAYDVAETQRAGGRFAPDELRSVAELVTEAEAGQPHAGACGQLGATVGASHEDDGCSRG
jgi:plasmid stabilization system protein ParE